MNIVNGLGGKATTDWVSLIPASYHIETTYITNFKKNRAAP